VEHELFEVEVQRLPQSLTHALPLGKMCMVGLVSGRAEVQSDSGTATLSPGTFCLVPACLRNACIAANANSEILLATAGAPA
jgi:hypothetical protein